MICGGRSSFFWDSSSIAVRVFISLEIVPGSLSASPLHLSAGRYAQPYVPDEIYLPPRRRVLRTIYYAGYIKPGSTRISNTYILIFVKIDGTCDEYNASLLIHQ